MKILVSELIWPSGLAKLKETGQVEYDPQLWQDRRGLLQKVRDVDALIIRNQTQVDHTLLEAAHRLRVVGRLGVGLDNIDLSLTKAKKIKVVYGRNANAISVAEYVLACLLEASRFLSKAHQDVRQGHWNRKRFTGRELYGKQLGLIGLGEIAHRVAKRAQAFGLSIVGYDPFVTSHDFQVAETGISLVSLRELLSSSDFISIHVPLNEKTRGMITHRELKRMKRHAYLINTSRGSIVDERDLLEAVQSGGIAGAFLDVLAEEPISPDNPLLKVENIRITPHIAGLTEESQERVSLLVAEEVSKVLRGQPSLCVLD